MSDLPNVIELVAGYLVSPATVELLAERADDVVFPMDDRMISASLMALAVWMGD